MTLRKTVPVAFRPAGLTDTIDSSTSFEGAMASLANLVPDPTTRQVWMCRPAAVSIANAATGGGPFSTGFSSGFNISAFAGPVGQMVCYMVIGDLVFGLVSVGVGVDYPFIFDLINKIFIPVSGIVIAGLPQTQPQTGPWIPPTMALVGTKVLVTHPGFLGGGSNVFFGFFDLTNITAPSWGSGNLTGAVQFLFPPQGVANFNGRAYWISNGGAGNQPATIFSDVLLGTNITSANQVITYDDQQKLTKLAPLPLQSPVTGGIIQGLLVFKGTNVIYQITGDSALGNLAKNALNVATGTQSPSTVVPCSKGVLFVSPDGLRLIDFNANVSDPIGNDGSGKVLAFLANVEPSRAVAACNGSTYRITVKDGSLANAPYVEYWFDIVRKIFSGPHTSACNWIDRYQNTFVVSLRAQAAQLFQSDVVQNQSGATSVFVENGKQLTFDWRTTLLPDTDQMAENAMLETTLYLALPLATTFTVFALNADGTVNQQANIGPVGQPTLWGAFLWGQALWGGPLTTLFPRPINWPKNVEFRRIAIDLQGNSSGTFRIGALHMRYEQLGYIQKGLAA